MTELWVLERTTPAALLTDEAALRAWRVGLAEDARLSAAGQGYTLAGEPRIGAPEPLYWVESTDRETGAATRTLVGRVFEDVQFGDLLPPGRPAAYRWRVTVPVTGARSRLLQRLTAAYEQYLDQRAHAEAVNLWGRQALGEPGARRSWLW